MLERTSSLQPEPTLVQTRVPAPTPSSRSVMTVKVVGLRRPWGSYIYSTERRAVAAARMVRENGWTRKQAAGHFSVNAGYIGLALRLGDEDRVRLERRELKLSHLWRDYVRALAERRAQRLAAEREAQARAERITPNEAVAAWRSWTPEQRAGFGRGAGIAELWDHSIIPVMAEAAE